MIVFDAQLGLQGGIFALGCSEEHLELHKAVSLLVEAPVGFSELIIVDGELPADTLELRRKSSDHFLQRAIFLLASFFRHFSSSQIHRRG